MKLSKVLTRKNYPLTTKLNSLTTLYYTESQKMVTSKSGHFHKNLTSENIVTFYTASHVYNA